MYECCVVLGFHCRPVHWHCPRSSSVYIPDDSNLWQVIWENRQELIGVAHSHPGCGSSSPSQEDLTTFAAIEAGIGRRLLWWIVTEDSAAYFWWVGPDKYSYDGTDSLVDWDWLPELRRQSGYKSYGGFDGSKS